MKKAFVSFLIAFSLFFVLGLIISTGETLASEELDPLGVDPIQYSGLSPTDPRVTIARLINVSFGLLGTLATALIFYAGFLWMTSAGNDDKAGEARKIIYAAVIGLIVLFSSYSIARFVLFKGYKATTGNEYKVFEF